MAKALRPKRKELTFYETIKRIKAAGLRHRHAQFIDDPDERLTIDEKVQRVVDFLKRIKEKRIEDMYCFVMYDIENDKIRNYISKYLIKQGCIRVQKSVFVANITRKMYLEISQTIAEVNAMYDNCDSIFFLPIGEDVMNNLKIVGKNIDLEVVMDPPNTLFF